MSTQRQLFYQHVGQTSLSPLGLEIEKAEGIYLWDTSGKRYIDLISGVSVSNVGHRNPKVIQAIHTQLEKYMHLMVYGEYIQAPQVQLAKAITDLLPQSLNSVYFVNSGSEAVEGALKLAKRHTGRPNIVSFTDAYHGSTHGALSIMGSETFRYAFRPLMPGVTQIRFNNEEDLRFIDNQTACVILDPLHSEAGIKDEENNYYTKLRKRCDDTGTLLVFDEVQAGFGRTGSMFYFEQIVCPDILVMAKAMGGGMPIGAFVASHEIMNSFTNNPPLGHITTFGGHPVCCASALASLEVILDGKLHLSATEKGNRLVAGLSSHPQMKKIRQKGLFLACDLKDTETYDRLLKICLENGLIIDSFLFKSNSFRIAPPLTVTDSQIDEIIELFTHCLDLLNLKI